MRDAFTVALFWFCFGRDPGSLRFGLLVSAHSDDARDSVDESVGRHDTWLYDRLIVDPRHPVRIREANARAVHVGRGLELEDLTSIDLAAHHHVEQQIPESRGIGLERLHVAGRQ